MLMIYFFEYSSDAEVVRRVPSALPLVAFVKTWAKAATFPLGAMTF